MPSADSRFYASSGNRLEALGLRDGEPSLLRTLDDALRNRVFRVVLCRCGQNERLVLGEALPGRNLDDAELPAGQCTRLVEEDGVDVASIFEAAPIAHEQAVPRAKRGGDGDHKRDR